MSESEHISKSSASKNSNARRSFFFQPKLTIGSPNDVYEQEADNIADKVMRMTDTGLTLKSSPVQDLISRKCAACEEEEKHIQKKSINDDITPVIQKRGNDGGGIASDVISGQIESAKGGGSPIDQSTRNFMETRFGNNFSAVRIHTDSKAVQLSQELNAQAFTVGNDVFFNQGKYNAESDSGKQLLAHELVHTVQQSGSLERKSIQRYSNECGKDFIFSFSGVINDETEDQHNGVPRAYYSEIPGSTSKRGKKIQGNNGHSLALIAGTPVEVGQFHQKYWRAVCLKPPGSPDYEIAWVLNSYISNPAVPTPQPAAAAPVKKTTAKYPFLKDGVEIDLDMNGSFSTHELHTSIKANGNAVSLTFRHIAGTKTQTLTLTPDSIDVSNAMYAGAGITDGTHPLEMIIVGYEKDKADKMSGYRIIIIPEHTPGTYRLKGMKLDKDIEFKNIDITGAQAFDLGVPSSFDDALSKKIIEEKGEHSKQGGTFRFDFKVGPANDVNFTLHIIKNPDDEDTVLCSIGASKSDSDKGIQSHPARELTLPIPVSFEELDIEKWKETNGSVSYRFLPPYSNTGFMVTYEINPLKKDNYVSSDSAHGLNIYPIDTSTDEPSSAMPAVKVGFVLKDGVWQYGFGKRSVESFRIESAKNAFFKLQEMQLPKHEINDLLNEMSLIVMLAVKENISGSNIYAQWMEVAYGVAAYSEDAAKGDDTAKQWIKDKSDAFITSLLAEIGGKGDESSDVNANGVGPAGGTITSKITNKYTGAQSDKSVGVGPLARAQSSVKAVKQPFEDVRALILSGNYNSAVTLLRSSFFLWVEDQLINNKNANKDTKRKLQAYGYQLSYDKQLKDTLSKEKTPLQKIKAIYYPDLGNVTNENGTSLMVGSEIKGIPLDLYYQEVGDDWVIYNFTTLTQPGKLNDFKRTQSKNPGEFAPPQEVFDLLTKDEGIGTGYIHYQTVIGEGGVVRVSHPWTLGGVILTAAAIVGLIALALTGVGLFAEGAAAASFGGAAALLGDIAAIATVVGASVKIGQDYADGAPVTAARWGELAIDVAVSVLPVIRGLRGIASLRQYKNLYVLMDVTANTQWVAKLDAAANVSAILVTSGKGVDELSGLSKALEEGRIDEATFYWAVVKNVGLGVINVVLLHSSIKTLQGRALGSTTLEEVITKGFKKELLVEKSTAMYSKENVEAGVETLLESSTVYRTMVVEALSGEKDFEKAIDVVCYLGSKERGALNDVMIIDGKVKRVIDVMIEGKFFGKTLVIPQGFIGSKGSKLDDVQRDFTQFSAAVVDGVHGVQGLKDAEIRLQGSATMGIAKPKTPTAENPKTWDYDLAIMMEATEYNKKLGSIFNNKVKYKDKSKGNIDLNSMSNEEIIKIAARMNADKLRAIDEREFNSVAHTFGNGIVTGKANMSSDYFPELALLNAALKKQFSIPDLDFSVIAKNSGFDSTPFITLQSSSSQPVK
ncbi:DUF4157 domain-containing protein [Dyadobacter sp. NIV53]|uniref:eCIS core domain-containing protein n=1 Tax=Dyadobacter sp. NIV53 TaxID=2861765 RepID=UPI001C8809D9|nr:DUF4157 domain-containing protein [Dyadobacter sp. NIV53]